MNIKQQIEDVKEKLRVNSFITDEKLIPFITEKVPHQIYYFKIGEDESQEYDCCSDKDKDCLEKALVELKTKYPNKEIDYIYSHNDSEHDTINYCCVCYEPLNGTMTWVKDEMDFILENKPYSVEFIKNLAFTVNAILNSQPSNDVEIGKWTLNQGGEKLEKAYQKQLDFFNEVLELSNFVMENF